MEVHLRALYGCPQNHTFLLGDSLEIMCWCFKPKWRLENCHCNIYQGNRWFYHWWYFSFSLSLSFLFLSSLVLLIMVLESLFNLKKKKKLMLQKELVGMVTFTESPMGSTVQGLAAYCSTEAVPVGLAMSWDVLTTSCGASKEALPLSSLQPIFARRISGSRPTMVAGAISPRNTLKCLRLLLLRLLRGRQTLSQFSIGGNN